MARQRLDAAEWAVLIDEWRRSGLSLPAFCKSRARRGAPVATAERPTPPPAFLPVRLAEVTAPTPTTGRAMTGMLAVFAEFERKILRERGRAGIAQARKEGRPLGRPRTASLKADHVLRLKAERVSHSEIARWLGIGRTSVRRSLADG